MEIIVVFGYGVSMLLGVAALAIQIFIKKKGIPVEEGTITGRKTTLFFSLIVLLNGADVLSYFLWESHSEISTVIHGFIMAGWLILAYFFTEFEREVTKLERAAWVPAAFYAITAGSLFLEFARATKMLYIPVWAHYCVCMSAQSVIWLFALVQSLRYTAEISVSSGQLNRIAMSLYNIAFLAYWAVEGVLTVYYAAGGSYFPIGDIFSVFAWSIIGCTNLYFVWQSCSPSGETENDAPDLAKLAERFKLSEREATIAGLLLEGKSNLEIAGDLQMSESAVKVHNHRLYKKLGVENRVQEVNEIRKG